MVRIGVDVDGVLACFFKGYEDLVVEVAGVDLFPARYPDVLPPTWNWPEHYGYGSAVMEEVWKRIKEDRNFWINLEPLPQAEAFLQALNNTDHEIYFITDRPGVTAQSQTAAWLEYAGFWYPSVIVSGRDRTKGDICRVLGLEAYLDDKGENIQDVVEKSPKTAMYMLKYPYNTAFQGLGTKDIDSIMEFIEVVTDAE